MLDILSVGIFCEIQLIGKNVLFEVRMLHRIWSKFEHQKQDTNNNESV